MAQADSKSEGVSLKAENHKVRIATDVIARIAGMAALDVDGVAALAQNLNREAIGKCSRSTLKNGVRVAFLSDAVDVDLNIIMSYGHNIPEVCRNVQKKVSQTITSMTGLKVADVNVRAAGVLTGTA